MKKDIYIIRNTVNQKVYIGQSVNAAHRWQQYLSDYRHDHKQLITRAMNKYGVENFYYEILESQVDNYDEREAYWIRLLNCQAPNGYNIMPGGTGTAIGWNNPSAMFTQEEVMRIIDDIINTKDSFDTIAKKYTCNASMISAINVGTAYHMDDRVYPLRLNRKDKELVKQVIYALQYETDKSMQQISKEFGFEISVVGDINSGKLHHIQGKEYPLRKGRTFSKLADKAEEAIDLLKNHPEIQQKDIARQLNVSRPWVSAINLGTSYYHADIEYPIRKTYENGASSSNRTLTPNEVREIEDLLKNTTKGVRKIANQYEVCYQTIMQINLGATLKYRQEGSQYPLRKK